MLTHSSSGEEVQSLKLPGKTYWDGPQTIHLIKLLSDKVNQVTSCETMVFKDKTFEEVAKDLTKESKSKPSKYKTMGSYTVGQKTVPMFGCFAKIEVEQIKKIR